MSSPADAGGLLAKPLAASTPAPAAKRVPSILAGPAECSAASPSGTTNEASVRTEAPGRETYGNTLKSARSSSGVMRARTYPRRLEKYRMCGFFGRVRITSEREADPSPPELIDVVTSSV